MDYINDDAWEFCKELTELDLRSNKLQLIDRFALAKLPSLRRLYLQASCSFRLLSNLTLVGPALALPCPLYELLVWVVFFVNPSSTNS